MVNNMFSELKNHICNKERVIGRLETDIGYVKDTCILLRDAWNLKEKKNSERDMQIAEARERLKAIDNIKEDAESFHKILLDTRDMVLHGEERRREFFSKWESRAWKIIATIGTGVIISILCDILK